MSRGNEVMPAVVVGGGPGGTGPLVCAAQTGRLGLLLDRGLLVLDRGTRLGAGSIGRYALNADSAGTSFLECLDQRATREALGIDSLPEAARQLEPYRDSHPPLSLVSDLLAFLGQSLEQLLARHERSRFVGRTQVQRLVLDPGGQIRVEATEVDAGGTRRDRVYPALSVVLALGGRQRLADALARPVGELARLDQAPVERIVLTDTLLTTAGLIEAGERLRDRARPKVLVIGSSHSAFSCAWALLSCVEGVRWGAGSIRIMAREEPRVFYPSAEAARADGYDRFDDRDICSRTGRVHRLGGLRGDGRELWRRITRRPHTTPETRVELVRESEVSRVRPLLDEADLIVPAFGYRAGCVPVFDASGHRVPLAVDSGGDLVDGECRVVRADGRALPNVFGIGMASGFRPSGDLGGEPSFRGQTNGVWLYQNGIGARVLNGLDAALARA